MINQVKSESKFENLFFYLLDMSLDLKSLDKLKKVSNTFFIWQLREIGAYHSSIKFNPFMLLI